MSKTVVLILFALLVLYSLVMVGSIFAQSIPKPSIPEFTVALVDSSYDVPTTYSIDPYTGENVTHTGYRVESRTIEIRIKNKPFTPFSITNESNTYTVQFYYNIRFKGHFDQEWREAYNPNINGYVGRDSGLETIISLQGEYSPTEGLKLTPDSARFYATFPPNAQVDFQMEAMIGYIHHVIAMPFSSDVFEGETSGWSETQTLTIEASQTPSPEPTPTSTPTSTPAPNPKEHNLLEMTILIALIVIATLLAVNIWIMFKKKR